MFTLQRTALSVASLGLVACAGDKPGDAVAQLAFKVVETFCERAVRCGDYADHDTCVSSNRSDYGQLIVDVNAGKTRYNPAAADQCLTAIGEVSGLGSCLVTEQLGAVFPQACRDSFQGTVADGQPCITSEQCISESCNKAACSSPGRCCVGVCNPTAQNPVPVGAPCGQAGAFCVPEALCQTTASGLMCVTKAQEAESCSVLGGCVAGLACVATDTTPICAHLPIEGERCDNVTSLECDVALDFCDPVSGSCLARIPVGGECPLGGGCVRYAYCDIGLGVCVARGAFGDRCVANIFACLGDLICEQGRCQFPPLGATCD